MREPVVKYSSVKGARTLSPRLKASTIADQPSPMLATVKAYSLRACRLTVPPAVPIIRDPKIFSVGRAASM